MSWSIKKQLKKILRRFILYQETVSYLKIADEIISVKGYNIKTKYIYGSRKAWRIPSFINEVDEEFFSPFGNFTGLTNFDSTLRALYISEQEFDEIFPQLKHIKGCSEFTKSTKN